MLRPRRYTRTISTEYSIRPRKMLCPRIKSPADFFSLLTASLLTICLSLNLYHTTSQVQSGYFSLPGCFPQRFSRQTAKGFQQIPRSRRLLKSPCLLLLLFRLPFPLSHHSLVFTFCKQLPKAISPANLKNHFLRNHFLRFLRLRSFFTRPISPSPPPDAPAIMALAIILASSPVAT